MAACVRGIDSSLPESCDPSAQVSSKPGEVQLGIPSKQGHRQSARYLLRGTALPSVSKKSSRTRPKPVTAPPVEVVTESVPEGRIIDFLTGKHVQRHARGVRSPEHREGDRSPVPVRARRLRARVPHPGRLGQRKRVDIVIFSPRRDAHAGERMAARRDQEAPALVPTRQDGIDQLQVLHGARASTRRMACGPTATTGSASPSAPRQGGRSSSRRSSRSRPPARREAEAAAAEARGTSGRPPPTTCSSPSAAAITTSPAPRASRSRRRSGSS